MEEILLKLSKQLFPTGRAFKIPENSIFEKFIKALVISENKVISDANSLMFGLLPDNDNFSEFDCNLWEKRLGLITNLGLDLETRKQAIVRKLNYPSNIKPRNAKEYIEYNLRQAGFDVYVDENYIGTFSSVERASRPSDFGVSPLQNQLGDFSHGVYNHGSQFMSKCVNHIDENLDNGFDVGGNKMNCFYIGDFTLGTFANVPLTRKDEFRQLILRLKPTNLVAYLFVNYI